MKVEQISIFLENKPGGLENVTRIRRDANINIRTLAVADTSDFGIVRLIVDHVVDAVGVLKANGYTVSRTNVVAVEVPDQPGGLHSILDVLAQAKSILNICMPLLSVAAKMRSCSSGSIIPTPPSMCS